jgi:F-type H+-transporting ATPase subunit delta
MKTVKQTRREAKRLYRLCLVNGLLDEDRARLIVRRVLDARRRDCQALLSRFLHMVTLDRARHTAKVESAVPLPEELRARIQSGLTKTYGPGISATFTHEPVLIGGMRIKVGSDVYDGSVRAKLAALEKSF